MDEVWIIGAGRFGERAFEKLSRSRRGTRFVVVDPDGDHLSKVRGPDTVLEQMDGVGFLAENLVPGKPPDWIIPAVPVHLAAEWALARLGNGKLRRGVVPGEVEPLVPHPMRGADGVLYVSHADFICPDDCAEPQNVCTVTQEPRKRNMFDILAELDVPPYRSLVIRSHQLGAGVGGYRPRQLFELLDGIERWRGPLLVSTACRCHGVITALERSNSENSSA